MNHVSKAAVVVVALAVAGLAVLKLVVPLFANLFAGVGVEVPEWLVTRFGLRAALLVSLAIASTACVVVLVGAYYLIRKLAH